MGADFDQNKNTKIWASAVKQSRIPVAITVSIVAFISLITGAAVWERFRPRDTPVVVIASTSDSVNVPSERNGSPKQHETHKENLENATPEQVVRAYLLAETWQERVPFVLNPERVAPIMKAIYNNNGIVRSVAANAKGYLYKIEKNGDNILVVVDTSSAYPEDPQWIYTARGTKNGYKIDWEKSWTDKKKRDEERDMQSFGLKDACIETHLQFVRSSSDYHKALLSAKNLSNQKLLSATIEIEVFDINSEFMYKSNVYIKELGVGETFNGDCLIQSNRRSIGSWKLRIQSVIIDLFGTKAVDVKKYFKLSEVDK